jgi:hypothetical protein
MVAREYGDGRGGHTDKTVFEDLIILLVILPSASHAKIIFPAKIDGESLRNIQRRD